MTLAETIGKARRKRQKDNIKVALLRPDKTKIGYTDEDMLRAAYKDMILYGIKEGSKAGLTAGAIYGAFPGNDMLTSLLVGTAGGAGIGALTMAGVHEGILPGE